MLPLASLRLVLLASTLLTFDDPSTNKGKIEGKWSSVAATVKGQTLPAGILKLEFGRNGSMVYVVAAQTFKGTYILGAGDSVTFKLDRKLAGRKTHVEKISISGKRMTVTDSDGTALAFEKVK